MTREQTEVLWRTWRRRRRGGAFEALVKPELPYALDLARRMGAGHADAEDAVSEALALLARERSDDPIRVGLRAWIGRRVVFSVRMRMRASSRRRRHERAAARPDRAAEPVPALEIEDEVERALGRLGAAERRTVLLRYRHDLEYREIAYVLGVSENACRLRVHKALKLLRSVLGPNAPALIAAIGLPAATAQAAMVSGAQVGVALAAKTKLAAAAVAVAAVTTAVVVLPKGEEPAPPPPAPAVVAQLPPEPAPEPEPAPTPEPVATPRPLTGIDLLARLLAGDGDAENLFWDFDKVSRYVRPPDSDPVRIEAADVVDLGALAGEAPRIEFGPGTFRLSTSSWRFARIGGRVEALELRGAGRERTTLVLPDGDLVTADGVLESLRVRDLTFQGGNLLDVRGEVAAVLENVRLRGRTEIAVARQGRALLALRNCEFLGGYRRPAGGHALDARGDVLALLDDCTLVDLASAVTGVSADLPTQRSLIHFRGCEFENAAVAGEAFRRESGPAYPLRVRGGTIRYGAARYIPESRLERWGDRFLTSFAGSEVLPGTHRCTLADLCAVLDRYPAERVAGVQALVWKGAALEHFAVHLVGPTGEQCTVLESRGAVVEEHDFTLPRFPPRSAEYRGPPLSAVLRAARLDPELEAHGVREEVHADPAGPVPVVYLTDVLGRRLRWVDARRR